MDCALYFQVHIFKFEINHRLNMNPIIIFSVIIRNARVECAYSISHFILFYIRFITHLLIDPS
jgi:hypothetical protein